MADDNAPPTAEKDALALALCEMFHDCSESAGWATCDHAFGIRDAKELRALVRRILNG